MTDNIQLNAGAGGDVFAADDIGGIKFPRTKLTVGADGVNDGDVGSGNPLPTSMFGVGNDGLPKKVNITTEGHIEAAIHSPLLPFGSLNVDSLEAIVQFDGVYGIPSGRVISSSYGSGSVTAANNMIIVSNGDTNLGSYASLQSEKRIRYKAGQGIVCRYSAMFLDGGQTGVTQVAGIGTAEAGYYFGYSGVNFGILHVNSGVREIQKYSITSAASVATGVTVVLNSVSHTVGVTASADGYRTAYELSTGNYPGWQAFPEGSGVIFLAGSAGNKTGSFSVSGANIAGSFSEIQQGKASLDTWIPQSEWNTDPCDGSGKSLFTLDPTKGNVYEISMQYLGFGSVMMEIEATFQDQNNPEFIPVHIFKFPNTRTYPHTTQPSVPFTMSSANATSPGASGIARVATASAGGFIAGKSRLNGPRLSYYGTATSSTSTYVPLFTIKNSPVFKGRANQSIINLLSFYCATKSNQGITTFYLIKNPRLIGNPNFQPYSNESCMYFDNAATACEFDSNDQIQFAIICAESDSQSYFFADDFKIRPGDVYSLAVKSVTATATCVGSINTREDQ